MQCEQQLMHHFTTRGTPGIKPIASKSDKFTKEKLNHKRTIKLMVIYSFNNIHYIILMVKYSFNNSHYIILIVKYLFNTSHYIILMVKYMFYGNIPAHYVSYMFNTR